MSCSYAEGLSEYHDKGKLGLPEKFDLEDEIRDKVETLTQWIREARHIVVHTGAGISTSAGIPDFRGPRGVWTLERRGEKPDMSLDWDKAVPTATHMALARLVEVGKVKFIITQNIDGLHLRSGVPRRNLAELHGNMFTDQCDKCKRMFVRDSPAPTVGQKFVGTDCPSVRSNGRNCRGKLKDFVLDWEHELPETDLSLSDSHSVLADLSIVMGSTLQIIPAGNMPTYAKKYHEDGRLVICNLQPTKQDKKADLNIHTYVDDVMRAVMKNLDLEIPEYDRARDPVRRVARGEWEGAELCVDWTQDEEEARAVKKLADTVHDDYLRRRRELKKRKSEHDAVINKRIKREDFEEQVMTQNKIEEPTPRNGRKCKKTDSYKIEDEEIDRLLEDKDEVKEEISNSNSDTKSVDKEEKIGSNCIDVSTKSEIISPGIQEKNGSNCINIDVPTKSEIISPENDQQILLTS